MGRCRWVTALFCFIHPLTVAGAYAACFYILQGLTPLPIVCQPYGLIKEVF